MTHRKKLIEVALPLEAINRESAREKSIRHGHPSTLHLWWSRKPLATARAVLFASLVDDPSSRPDRFPTEAEQDAERQRLFRIIEELVRWENSNNEHVLAKARREILRSTDGNPPPVLDPFAGGGSIPLEAQRLGLEAHASDLNPVAVLINKALIEIPPKFAGQPPVNPKDREHGLGTAWKGAAGLAADVRYYGQWMRDEAERRIGPLYPKVRVNRRGAEDTEDSLRSPRLSGSNQELTVIAWLWVRTVRCPNPACGAQMPLANKFWLSTKKGKQAWVEPIVEGAHPSIPHPPTPAPTRGEGEDSRGEPDSPSPAPGRGGQGVRAIRFEVRTGAGTPPEGTVNRRGARCLVCGTPVPFDHIRAEGKAGRMGQQLMAIVAEGKGGRVYLSPTPEHEEIAAQAQPTWVPDTDLPEQALGFRVQLYGMTQHRDLFTPRQLVALTTFSDLVSEARERVLADARAAWGAPPPLPSPAGGGRSASPQRGEVAARPEGGDYAAAYADAVATYLALAVDRLVDRSSTICSWDMGYVKVRNTFGRQAIPMTWDFAEANPFSDSTGNFVSAVEWIAKVLRDLVPGKFAKAQQLDATAAINGVRHPLISTDPPYYDNIGYADLSDFFYVWLRRSLGAIYPDLFSTLLVPKTQELVATPYRFGGSKEKAQQFFEEGLGKAFAQMRRAAHPDYPLTVYYAFKQAESDEDALTPDPSPEVGEGGRGSDGVRAVASTGWETMLEGLMRAGFQITGTWPMRSELSNRMIASGTNALASSIVLVCRPRPEDAPVATRREFINALRRELPEALRQLQHGNIAPVDLAQAAIGPGMAVFSRYRQVVESDGTPMRVRTALQLINAALDEVLAEQEGEYDNDTRWALAWFEQYGMAEGPFGVAETLSKAKNTSVGGLVEAGILQARGGKVRLLRRDELPADWDPTRDRRVSVWEVTQHLIRALDLHGEAGAAQVLQQVRAMGEAARDLAYRLYTTCERKKWSDEALAYNSLVVAWPSIVAQMAARPGVVGQGQLEL
ncbi:DUF1156 domain-containing protein [Kallotenue papyrolyticum]|uniref:DUF1156 domain-containing protein n=1 Tax=Kallotenue papyrolyticum TaxID=1325125 RepID=UPI00047857BD|nr:DUF1156 domain-containing protein [Kallotenue papyrolyticum]